MNIATQKPAHYQITNSSGFDVRHSAGLPSLKQGKFRIVQATVAGDAPKDFLHIYQYGYGRSSTPRSWPAWIAKVGHKYYPNESITEHLLTRVGQALGLNVADSQLMWFRGQLRFLSRHFLKPKTQSLVHGAEIFAGFLADREFVEEVEKQGEARNLFTFQFVEDALMNRFPSHWQELRTQFIRMLAFDAIVGNNDRHFYNWGIIVDIMGKYPPLFSPIFDTARALYWNTPESQLAEIARDRKRRQAHLIKYVERCYPKTGWEKLKAPNHFELISHIAKERSDLRPLLENLCHTQIADKVTPLLQAEFKKLISPLRADFILECLDRRAILFRQAVSGAT